MFAAIYAARAVTFRAAREVILSDKNNAGLQNPKSLTVRRAEVSQNKELLYSDNHFREILRAYGVTTILGNSAC